MFPLGLLGLHGLLLLRLKFGGQSSRLCLPAENVTNLHMSFTLRALGALGLTPPVLTSSLPSKIQRSHRRGHCNTSPAHMKHVMTALGPGSQVKAECEIRSVPSHMLNPSTAAARHSKQPKGPETASVGFCGKCLRRMLIAMQEA